MGAPKEDLLGFRGQGLGTFATGEEDGEAGAADAAARRAEARQGQKGKWKEQLDEIAPKVGRCMLNR